MKRPINPKTKQPQNAEMVILSDGIFYIFHGDDSVYSRIRVIEADFEEETKEDIFYKNPVLNTPNNTTEKVFMNISVCIVALIILAFIFNVFI